MTTSNDITRERIAATEAVIRPYVRRTPLLHADLGDFGLPAMPVTFKLRDEARWNDGTPITPEDVVYSLDENKAANRARIVSETTPEFQRRSEARDTKELVIELIRSLKYILRAAEEEMRWAGRQ